MMLVVDDKAILAVSIAERFQITYDVAAITAHSFEEAKERIGNNPGIGFVVTDYKLDRHGGSGGNGYDVAKFVKKHLDAYVHLWSSCIRFGAVSPEEGIPWKQMVGGVYKQLFTKRLGLSA